MKSCFRSLLTTALFIVPVLAQAHPGHDGDHELVWDFNHLVSHPLATIACLVVLAGVGFIVWQCWRNAKQAKVTQPTQLKR